ncbi:isoquinoline 1-oxidoreductase subunit alpha [Treponema primitia ZAS-2]|uniref:Isoquinoline 1-oxidoreductase subunit alpha n=1 Tax=Treponema primitia (strain ATCC BAA-887 / DSM 12427 / ZAS-2) TaxID=545694 RepID=F5YHU7_TREPZ|nr:2Fe-2S iron-sulfur cluster-binding protein [Treponema primitia]AEF86636.1 isoquinoline 1-oxidoreductase subunit alpha [Treponema primitia ZAS-2]
MTLGFILNGEDVVVKTEADRRLLDILRNHFKLLGAKPGCLSGVCGACAVILNGKVVSSCMIPAFRIRGSEIITIEGFSQTNEYQDIQEGFSRAGVENCGYCDSGKILAVETLLDKNLRPTREDILEAFSGIKCRCTEPDSLIAGVFATAEIRQRRLYGRSA